MMHPDDMTDEFVSFMAGHLRGWTESGGTLTGWQTYHKLSIEEIVALDARVRQVTAKVASGGSRGAVKADSWVVVWSQSEHRIQITSLEDSLAANVEAVCCDTANDYTILSVWPTQGEAMKAAKDLEPLLRTS